MQTYSHFLLTAVLNRPLKKKATESEKVPPVRTGALMLGSIMPDLPLIGLTIGCIVLDLVSGIRFNPENEAAFFAESYVGRLFRDWFFNDPWVIALHNLFHSPLLCIAYMLIAYWAWRRGKKWAPWFFWLAAASLLHTLIDIPLHYDDGPLLLFPLNWSWRFYSPVSYWDPAHYGREFGIFEHLLDVVLLGVLLLMNRQRLWGWVQRRLGRQTVETVS